MRTARLVLTPDAKLATPIAIAGWGVTYTATCIDKASLNDFIVKNAGPWSLQTTGKPL